MIGGRCTSSVKYSQCCARPVVHTRRCGSRSIVFDLDSRATAVIDCQDVDAGEDVESDDQTDKTNPFDGVVEVEVNVLACVFDGSASGNGGC